MDQHTEKWDTEDWRDLQRANHQSSTGTKMQAKGGNRGGKRRGIRRKMHTTWGAERAADAGGVGCVGDIQVDGVLFQYRRRGAGVTNS